MTLLDLIDEVEERTHFGKLEILEKVREAWPLHTEFTPTQCALVVNSIQRKEGKS